MPIEFRKARWPSEIRRPNRGGDIVVYLLFDMWDDFGWKTLFHLHIATVEGIQEVGDVKILRREGLGGAVALSTEEFIDEQFPELSRADFASLGQSLAYYRRLLDRGAEGREILRALCDVAADPLLRAEWADDEAFTTSLLRFSDAKGALSDAPALIADTAPQRRDPSFTYKVTLDGARAPHEVRFDFKRGGVPSRRVHVVIGPNGTGKTALLHAMGADFAEFGNTRREVAQKGEISASMEEPFRRQILVSMNSFDAYRIPTVAPQSSFRFVGPRWSVGEVVADVPTGPIAPGDWARWLTRRFPNRQAFIANIIPKPVPLRQEDVASLWRDDTVRGILRAVLGDAYLVLEAGKNIGATHLSAGQHALLSILAGLHKDLVDFSLVLVDEPESHLHPSYLYQFSRVLNVMLEQRDSYAVVCTHSPLVLQDVPTDCVTILDRDDRTPVVRRLGLQSYGAGVGELSFAVFGADPHEAKWAEVLKGLATTTDEPSAGFTPTLGPQAMSVILGERLHRQRAHRDE